MNLLLGHSLYTCALKLKCILLIECNSNCLLALLIEHIIAIRRLKYNLAIQYIYK